MNHVQRVEQDIDVRSLNKEIEQNASLWLANTSRQEKVRCQRDTQTIFIRTPTKPFPEGAAGIDVRDSDWTRTSQQFPLLTAWLESFAQRVGGQLGRVFLVRLKPGGRVYRHRDAGSYYECRDRFHVILQSSEPSSLTCGDQRVHMRRGEAWWFDNQLQYEERNDSDSWRVHLIVDVLPVPSGPPSSRRRCLDSAAGHTSATDGRAAGYQHFELIKRHVEIGPMLEELDSQADAWEFNKSRQTRIRVQRETNNIHLRTPLKPFPTGIKGIDVHPSGKTKLARRFPNIYGWVEAFSQEQGGELARLTIVQLNPHAQVYEHIDEGEYYRARDRYHLVLRSQDGSEMLCGGERVVFHEGELWWFDNNAPHEAYNASDVGRIHIIFDVRPIRRPRKMVPAATKKPQKKLVGTPPM